jgi:hypothetical protein
MGDDLTGDVVERLSAARRLLAQLQNAVDTDPGAFSGAGLHDIDAAVNGLQNQLNRTRSSVRRAAASRPSGGKSVIW